MQNLFNHIWLGFLYCSRFYIGISLALPSEANKKLGSVILVNVLYRHGDRTPTNPYPNDPYRNLSYWPVGWGQLTNTGKVQHYNLGMWLHDRYKDLVPEKYSKDDVHIISTDVDRTLMSAASNLAGFYPPKGDEIWQDGINWQPIPIHTTPEHLDELLAAKRPCPKYDMELAKVASDPEMVKINEENADLYAYLTQNSGSDIHDVTGVDFLYSTLFIEKLNNFTLPDWTKPVYDRMFPLAAFSFRVEAYNTQLQRLKSGPLLKQMIKHMKEKMKGTLSPDRKMFVYSAHDTTIANFLSTLGVFDTQRPPFASLVVVELRKSASGQYQITVLFRNSTEHEPYLLQIPGCDAVCPFEEFVKITSNVVPGNWEKECQITYESYIDFNSTINVYGLALMTFGVILFAIAVLMLKIWFRIRNISEFSHHYSPLKQDEACH